MDPRGWTPERWAVAAVVAVLGVLFAIGLATVGDKGLTEYDAWQIWTRKAILLFYGDTLPVEILGSPVYVNAHGDYPILLPLLEALHFRALGRPDTGSVHVVFWLLLIAFAGAAAQLGTRVARPAVVALVVGAVAVLSVRPLLTAYADVPLAFLLGLGLLATGLWLDGGRRSDLAVGAVFLAGAASMKNEGLLGAAVVLGVTVAAAAARRRPRAVRDALLAVAAVTAVAVLPWRLWLAAHGIEGDLPVTRGVDPGFLAERVDRVWPSVTALHGQIVGQSLAALLVPLAVALCLLWARRRPVLVGFYALCGVLYFAALVWAYWISPLELDFHLGTSASRVSVGVGFIALAAVLHLGGGRAADAGEAPPPA